MDISRNGEMGKDRREEEKKKQPVASKKLKLRS
jgi:hypothetical protein